MTFSIALRTLQNPRGTKKEVKKSLLTIKEYLKECNNAYYLTDQPIISNSQFDQLLKEYRYVIKIYKLQRDSDLNFTTAISSSQKLNHKVVNLLGTLEKANSFLAVKAWFNGLTKYLQSDDFSFIVSLKYDGNSVCITYDENGKVTSATTRGKNGVGENVTHIFQDKHSIVHPLNEPIAVRYEVITTDENYLALINNTNVKYANNRSVVAGIIHRNDGADFYKYLSLVPLEIRLLESDRELSRLEQLSIIDNIVKEKSGNLLPFQYKLFVKAEDEELRDLQTQITDFEKYYEAINSPSRLEMTNFMFDGLVIEILDDDIRRQLGYSAGMPNFSIALKFDYLEQETTVLDVRFDYGRSGRITPVIQYEPIFFFGNEQQFTSVANYKRFNELNLRKGDKILVQFRNDVLSYISSVVSRNERGKPLQYIESCPLCNEDLYLSENEVFISCENQKCFGRIVGKIEQYCINMGMKGIRFNTLLKLYEAGVIQNITDLYKDTLKEEIQNTQGFTTISARNIVDIITDNKSKFDYEVLGSLSITGVNLKRCKALMEKYTIRDILQYCEESLGLFTKKVTTIEGFGDILAKNLYMGLKENSDIIEYLLRTLEIKEYKMLVKKFGESKKFVITGDLSVPRDEFVRKLEMNGHKVVNSVSSKTDYLITNTPNSGTVKNRKASDLNIPIITEKECMELFKL